MKTALALIVFLSTSLALAYPTVNDYSKFNAVHSVEGPFTLELKLASFDTSRNAYQQVTTQVMKGQVQNSSEWINKDDMYSKAQHDQVMAYCAQAGGKLETVTVPAGTFKSCALPQDDADTNSTYWISDVPFGIVKAMIAPKDGSGTIAVELQTFRHGN